MTDPTMESGSSRGPIARANAARCLAQFRELAHD
jgi:hypothetical protein